MRDMKSGEIRIMRRKCCNNKATKVTNDFTFSSRPTPFCSLGHGLASLNDSCESINLTRRHFLNLNTR